MLADTLYYTMMKPLDVADRMIQAVPEIVCRSESDVGGTVELTPLKNGTWLTRSLWRGLAKTRKVQGRLA
jgi:hypothetical protein